MSLSREKIDELLELLWRVRDDEATEEDRERIYELIASDPAVRHYYVRYSMICAGLRWRNAGGIDPATMSLADRLRLVYPLVSEPKPRPSDEKVGWLWQRRRQPERVGSRRWMLPVAACLVLIGITLAFWRSQPIAKPIEIARLTGAYHCRWDDGGSPRLGRHLARRAALRLVKGRAEVTFATGAVVRFAAPAELLILGPNAARLTEGSLVARAGREAMGFSIETPGAIVVDRGTEFGVAVRGEETGIAVFEGVVDLTALAPDGSAVETITARAGEGARWRPGAERIEASTTLARRFESLRRPLPPGIAALDGSITFEPRMPASVVPGGFERNGIRLFLEQEEIVLPEEVTLTTTSTGYAAAPFTAPVATVESGRRVRSYLVHLDEIGWGQGVERRATVSFDAPIIGLAMTDEHLAQSDRVLGSEDVEYRLSRRGLDSHRSETKDSVILSADRHTLQMTLYGGSTGRGNDQIRVVVDLGNPSLFGRLQSFFGW
ncbi:FecR protein [Planctomycetes bacterium Pan216]|uniref:FecR protein n=1 Tax=Kolteria novifilia TaxID=2527975 RepID=A0A518B002_9BACT|nr:FecR protein [Planctomycetes bacterium Pan216]